MSEPLSEETKANIADLKVIVLGQTSEHVKLISYDRSSLHYDALNQVSVTTVTVKRWYSFNATRVADVGEPWEPRCTKGQGLLRKEGPPIYAILSRNLVLSCRVA